MAQENTVLCLKSDPDDTFLPGEVYVVVGRDSDNWMPIVDLATSDNQKEVGVVFDISNSGDPTVIMQFSGVIIVNVSVPTGNADPGLSLGTVVGSKIAKLNGSGIGLILRQLETSGVERSVLANLSAGGEATIRWKKFETV